MGSDCKYDMIEMIGIRMSLWLAPKHSHTLLAVCTNTYSVHQPRQVDVKVWMTTRTTDVHTTEYAEYGYFAYHLTL